MPDSPADRFQLARKIASKKQDLAQAVTDECFAIHPEWLARYGEPGRQFCHADMCFHVDFLAGAVEAGSPQAFGEYALWTARMLGARGIAAHSLEENLDVMGRHLCRLLTPKENGTLLAFLAAGKAACAEPEKATEPEDAGDALALTRQVFLAAILGGNRLAAVNIVEEALREGHSHLDIYADVFSESLHRVGELWERNKISVAQEHIATSVTQYAIAAIYPRMVPAGDSRGSMVVTGVAGELHQIGANLVADSMEAGGWKVRLLGTNLPHSSVLSTIEEISADVLCISTTTVANLPSVADLIGLVRSRLSSRAPRIVLGGAAYRVAGQFARDFGAGEAVTDLRRGVALLCP
jgi:methanogenic corrinoid protein MtbC1